MDKNKSDFDIQGHKLLIACRLLPFEFLDLSPTSFCRRVCHYIITVWNTDEDNFKFEKVRVDPEQAPKRKILNFMNILLPRQYIESAKDIIYGHRKSNPTDAPLPREPKSEEKESSDRRNDENSTTEGRIRISSEDSDDTSESEQHSKTDSESEHSCEKLSE